MPMKVLGPAKDGEVWRILFDRELYELSEEPRHYGSDEVSTAYVDKTNGHIERQCNASIQKGEED